MGGQHAASVGIWGSSGTGKTTYLVERLKGVKRVIVVDVKGSMVRHGYKRCDTVEQVRQAMIADWRGFRLAFVPKQSQIVRELNQLSSIVYAAGDGYLKKQHSMILTLAVDEMADAFPAKGGFLKYKANFGILTSMGRESGIEIIGCSQRIAEVDSRFRGNCQEAIVFGSTEVNDCKRSADTVGVKWQDIHALPNFEYIHRMRDRTTVRGKTKKT